MKKVNYSFSRLFVAVIYSHVQAQKNFQFSKPFIFQSAVAGIILLLARAITVCMFLMAHR